MVEYKAALRGAAVIVAQRFYPTSKTCSECGLVKQTVALAERLFHCDDCCHEQDRDLNAAVNLARLNTLRPDVKRTQELCKTMGSPTASALMA
jgi:putative transposase